MVYEDYNSTYKELLIKANKLALHIRRMRNMAMETFRILNELAPPVLSDILVKKETSYNFRYSDILQVPQVKSTRQGKNSFRYAAPVLWNSLPCNFRTTTDFSEFKTLISRWSGKDCICPACNTMI